MTALKSSGWDFIVKAIEALDSQLGLGYISTPLPLLWKVIREALPCSGYAIKFLTSRLLKVRSCYIALIQANVPSSVHQQFVETTVDEIIEIGNRFRRSTPIPPNQELNNFRGTFDTLSYFLADYKKSVHEKNDETTPTSSESMDIESEKKVIIARCTRNSGQKEVSPCPSVTNDSTAISHFLPTPLSKSFRRLLRQSYASFASEPSLKVAKSPVRNLNNLKLYKNGVSKN